MSDNLWVRINNEGKATPKQQAMLGEAQDESTRYSNSRSTVRLLEELYLLPNGDNQTKRKIKNFYLSRGKNFPTLGWKLLTATFRDLNGVLNKEYFQNHWRSERVEKHFASLFRHYCKRWLDQSVWIGNYQVDALLISARGEHFHGIAYEIDGGIHNNEIKMARDTKKELFLQREIGLLVKHIDNVDTNRQLVLQEISHIKNNVPTLDSRSFRNLWRRIYFETIAQCHDKPKVAAVRPKLLCELLNLKQSELREILVMIETLKPSARFVEKSSEAGISISKLRRTPTSI